MCWSTVSENSLDKLETIQGDVLKSIMKIKGKVSYNALDVEAGILPIKIRLKQILAQFGIKLLRKSDNNPIKILLTNNLSRKSVGKAVTLADKIRMALMSYTKNKIDVSNLEPEITPDKIVRSVIETDLFLWTGHGNSSNRTEHQKDEIKRIVDNFLSSITQNTTVCFTDGSVISPDKHGLGKCGAGVVLYKDGLNEAPNIYEINVSTYSNPYHGELTENHLTGNLFAM